VSATGAKLGPPPAAATSAACPLRAPASPRSITPDRCSHHPIAATDGIAPAADHASARSARARPTLGAIAASCTMHAIPIHA
jgi:hypothetical protein